MAAFLHFSASEVESGLSFAQENHHMHLNREMLKNFANQTGVRWSADGKRPGDILRVKRIVLRDVWEKHRIDSVRRDAYSAAISHMFGIRNQHARAARSRKECGTEVVHAPQPPLPSASFAFGESGQGEFLFGSRN